MREVLVERRGPLSRRTAVHWATVFLLSVSGLLTILTAICSLFLPSGGYQGGRNPHYGQTLIFDRYIWSDIHTWAGIVMIAVSLFHIAIHWRWVAEMGRRSLAVARGRRKPFNRKIWLRVGVVAAVGLLFVGVAASGIYFFVTPSAHGSGRVVLEAGQDGGPTVTGPAKAEESERATEARPGAGDRMCLLVISRNLLVILTATGYNAYICKTTRVGERRGATGKMAMS